MVKLLAERGYVLGVDALAKAKEIDEKHGAQDLFFPPSLRARLSAAHVSRRGCSQDRAAGTDGVPLVCSHPGLTLKAKEVSEQLRLKERVEAAAEAAKPVGAMAKQFATEGAVKARETALHAVDRAKELNEKYQLAEKSKARAAAVYACGGGAAAACIGPRAWANV